MLLIRFGAGGEVTSGAAPALPRLTPPAVGMPPGVLVLGVGGGGGAEG